MLPESERKEAIQALTPNQAEAFLYDWPSHARPEQLPPPGDWHTWLILAGRGFGKTRAGLEYVRAVAESGNVQHIALVAETAADARDVLVEGPESGLLAICPPWAYPKYEASKRRVTWPNGTFATTYSGDEPDQLRGPQHGFALMDEFAKYRYPQDCLDNLEFGLRIGEHPRIVMMTTPKPVKALKKLVADQRTVVTGGSSFANKANLAPSFIHRIITQYEGTRIGRQEVHAELLEDVEGALWTHEMLDDLRVREAPDMQRIVVAIDPAVTAGEDSDETGIITAGRGLDDRFYVLADSSGRHTPHEWARRAVDAYYQLQADCIVAEVNNGGDMCEHTIHTVDRNVRVKKVHASRGKLTRAEPVVALYEQRRAHHIGNFADLESQMCSWVPGESSPDRMDALVWAATELLLEGYHGPLGLESAQAYRDEPAIPLEDREEIWGRM